MALENVDDVSSLCTSGQTVVILGMRQYVKAVQWRHGRYILKSTLRLSEEQCEIHSIIHLSSDFFAAATEEGVFTF